MTLDAYAADFLTQAPTMTESIARALRQAILDGSLVGGSTIRQEEVARKFGVSRVPIREALLKLEGEGLVETQPRRGVVVTSLSQTGFEEILDMRIALESLAIEQAVKRFTPADARAAMQIVEEARAGMRASASPDLGKEIESRWGDLNWEFHRRLYAPAARPRLLASIENLQQLFARHLRARIASKNDSPPVASRKAMREDAKANLQEWAAVIDEHEQMVVACARHDAPAAIKVLRHHISDHGTELVQRLRETLVPSAVGAA
jgi:DNA-binding GntR family transcriptional regulator